MSGMNLAWMDFANDLGNFNETLFTQRVESLAAAGGNTIRWWLHTNGRYSPQFKSGVVSGINPAELVSLQRALDIAFERGVLLMLCLWSFDMLQPNAQEVNWPRNRALLEDPVKTQAYIDNALIPMVEAVKGHPGIAAWEIFNEPEGMITGLGWTPQRVNFIHVQRFVNMTAGAIKRTDPDTKVSNGSWNIRVLTDIGSFTNYYRDDRLIAAGGDPDGVLDFYMVHYYPQHFGASQSPFHNHAAHWQLDKPILIAEFPSLGVNLSGRPLTTLQAFQYALGNGYAGALSWTMTGHDGNGGLPESTAAMQYLQDNYPDIINVQPDPDFPYPPFQKQEIQPFFAPRQIEDSMFPVEDLNNIFGHQKPDMPLEYSILSVSSPQLVVPKVSENDSLIIEVLAGKTGFADITVRATDTLEKFTNARLSVSVYDPESDDRLLLRLATASTIENAGHLASYAVDGVSGTRWSSVYADNQWLMVQMEHPRSLTRVMLRWETAYGAEYAIDVSDDGKEWNTVYHEPAGNGGWDKVIFEPVTAKYIRMNGIRRATGWGFSLWSFQAFDHAGENTPPVFTGVFRDTIAWANTLYRAVIPLNIVTDPDLGERLFFRVTGQDNTDLPDWLNFDPTTRILSGTPAEEQSGMIYPLVIEVTDMSGDSDHYLFDLYVDPATSIADQYITADNFLVYPVPAAEQLILTNQGQYAGEVVIRLLNLKGQELYSWLFEKTENNEKVLDVSGLKTGIYLLQIAGRSLSETILFSKR